MTTKPKTIAMSPVKSGQIAEIGHDGDTLAVRGILCNRCNTVLGLCEDDDKLLSTLARYLRKCHG